MTIIIYVIERIVEYNNYRLYLFLWVAIKFLHHLKKLLYLILYSSDLFSD